MEKVFVRNTAPPFSAKPRGELRSQCRGFLIPPIDLTRVVTQPPRGQSADDEGGCGKNAAPTANPAGGYGRPARRYGSVMVTACALHSRCEKPDVPVDEN